MFMKALPLFLCFLSTVKGAENGLALTPQMGWNTWNHFGCSIDENLILGAAKAIIQNNLTSFGYQCTSFIYRLLHHFSKQVILFIRCFDG